MSTSKVDAYVVRCDYPGCAERTLPADEGALRAHLTELGWTWDYPDNGKPLRPRAGRHYCPAHRLPPEPDPPAMWQDSSGNWWATSNLAPGEHPPLAARHVMLTGDRPGRWEPFHVIVGMHGAPRTILTPPTDDKVPTDSPTVYYRLDETPREHEAFTVNIPNPDWTSRDMATLRHQPFPVGLVTSPEPGGTPLGEAHITHAVLAGDTACITVRFDHHTSREVRDRALEAFTTTSFRAGTTWHDNEASELQGLIQLWPHPGLPTNTDAP